MKIKIFCEGKTEKGLRELLQKAVNQNLERPCGLKIKSYEGVGNLLKGIEGKINVEFQTGAKVVYLLVDLYHYPNIEPNDLEVRVRNVNHDIQAKLGRNADKVKIFVIIHEVETWILADTEVISKKLKTKLSPFVNLESDGQYDAPAQFLKDLFSKHKKRYSKVKEGVHLLESANWEKIYDSCVVFKNLVDALRHDCMHLA